MENAWRLSEQEVLDFYKVQPDRGLNTEQVLESRRQHGVNELEEEPPTPLWQLILEQFKDQLVVILLCSAVVSLVLALIENEGSLANALVEPMVIFLILIANAVVGVLQERNADQSIQALRAYSPEQAIVHRNGHTSRLDARDLVPGDIVVLSTGDRVPADCRVIELRSSRLQVDQAILTGESESVYKSTQAISDTHAVKQDMTNMLFCGTSIVNGSCIALVVLTGTRTAIGDIHTEIGQESETKTPLQQKLDDFGELLAKAIMVICILVWVVNVRNFFDPVHHGWVRGAVYYFKIAVALAVAAIPEGLAAVITACLALGTQKMARKNAIVRHLPSVETLGSTSVICSDKTGTLTTNQMSVAQICLASDISSNYDVSGTTFAPDGGLSLNGVPVLDVNVNNSSMQALVETCAVCNDAKISVDKHGQYKALGQATEAALKTLVEKIGHHDADQQAHLDALEPGMRANAVSSLYMEQLPRLYTLEFSRDRKMMSAIVRRGSQNRLLVKGAPESVLARSTSIYLDDTHRRPLDEATKASLQDTIHAYGREGLRALAIAVRDNVRLPNQSDLQDSDISNQLENDLAIVGIVGMRDPPRPEVRAAVQESIAAGVRIVVITGDNQHTAEAICRQIGLFDGIDDLRALSFTGRDLDLMSEKQKLAMIPNVVLFSRTEPSHKSQIVDLLQSQSEVVAMTGDGVNDAPALKRADIGIAMGTGTDVAKLAADMVLADNNFATIVSAIEEGRSIFNNTQAFIRYLISSNIGEVVSIFLTVLLGMPEALIPVQLLWVNLVTDGLPATALGFNPPDRAVMRVSPRKRDEPLISGWLFVRYMLIGSFVGVATVFGYAWWFMFYEQGPQISFYQLTHFHHCASKFPELGCEIFQDVSAKRASTMSLSILVTIEMFNALNSLSEVDSLLTHPPFKNLWLVGAIGLSMALHMIILYVPYFRELFSITPLNSTEWLAVLAISFPVVILDEICKFFARRALHSTTQNMVVDRKHK
ncbi:P-type Ca(2+) transporter [Malassezia yamatoensis]|uniref:Calcium-transporting ATPase n=1 Tax=Malassezia yamatoensis TaxID=253288 RepID=A0AAJ6CG48_9BASI|nr:P-type Ca(2+) transporter [Malassezia yamatoensis]